jgi:hypothetical protein
MQTLVKSAQRNYSLAVTLLQKKQTLSGNGLSKSGRSSGRPLVAVDEDDRASFRVKDVIGALRVTADRRREQSDQKKNTGFSSAWVQSFPGLPSSLKKSLWHKMHRRKQQVILRLTHESLVSELRTIVVRVTAAKYSERSKSDKMEKIEAEMMKAEQLYLLATHPVAEEPLQFVPPTKSSESWAEPGWKLDLSVQSDEAHRASMILPCSPSFPVLESYLSELSSTPGRQAASLLRTSHFRSLASPLSAFAVASSPAESNSSFLQNSVYTEGDPLNFTDEDVEIGYMFTIKQQPPVKTTAPRRRASAPKTQSEVVSTLVDNTSKRPSLSGPSSGIGPALTESSTSQTAPDRKKGESKRRRSTAKSSDQASKKPKIDTSPTTTGNSLASQQYSPIVQKQLTQQQAQPPPPPPLQRQPTQLHHKPAQVHQQQQRQHVTQLQQMTTQQQRQMHHQVSRHPSSQHHQQLSSSQHHQQLSSSQHHQQHLPQHTTQPHPSQHQHSSQQQYPSPQMAQMRMMQQQSQQMQNMSPRHQQVPTTYPPQAIQQMQQFYAPLNHPPAPMHMQGRTVAPHQLPPLQPPQGMPSTGQSRKPDDASDASDPLFMLK